MTLSKSDLLAYTEKAVAKLLKRGHFMNGDEFRTTQRDALEAYLAHLRDSRLPIKERLGFTFELSMALGKTAIYLGIFEEIYKLAKADGRPLTGAVVVPLISIFDSLEDEIAKYAPSLAAKTTYYGDGTKELGGDFGVYTYHAFMDLHGRKAIKPDVLFSDEAHRGTSDVRSEVYLSSFLGKIVSIGLTATGAFDKEKTIQKTHGRHGFRRTSAESIRLGELAEYAQSQLHVIRVAPRKVEPVFASDKEKSRYEAALRKKAWTDATRAILERGKDEHTGDPLSDNVSAFYCADIQHIEETADALNASAILRKKAKALGYDGVAVNVHSLMRPAERKAAMRAFNEGRFMAIVSDGVIKEGYNNARIKNIFDYPRNSIVEKAQIIGRALRRLWNKLKKRWEGATIVDTVIYHGHKDPAVDRANREAALLNVVTAWQVLTDTVIYGPGAKPAQDRSLSEASPPLEMDGFSVESITKIESINTIRAGIDEFNQRMVDLDEVYEAGKSRREVLCAKLAGLGLGAKRAHKWLGRWAQEHDLEMPEGLTPFVMHTWLEGRVRKAERSEFEFVMRALQTVKAAQPITWIELDVRDPKNGLTPRQDLMKEAVRAGLSYRSAYHWILQWAGDKKREVPPTLKEHIIQNWMVGRSEKAQSRLFNFVMEALRAASDADVRIKLDDKLPGQKRTPREQLILENQRTGFSGRAAYDWLEVWARRTKTKIPQDLNLFLIQNWLDGKVKTAPKATFEFVMTGLRACDAAHYKAPSRPREISSGGARSRPLEVKRNDRA